MFVKIIFSLLLSLPLLLPAIAQSSWAGENEIYFVRHAESMGNLTHKHTQKNDRTLSPKGIKQAQQLMHTLDSLHIDVVIVSPKYRALLTILPYLKSRRITAEIWPELAECCWQKKQQYRSPSYSLARGKKIKLTTKLQRWFSFPDTDSHYNYHTRNYPDGLLQTQKAVKRLKESAKQSDKTILIIGHYHAGSRLLEMLQNLEPIGRYKLANTSISHLVEKADGSYLLLNQKR
ncbi:MAG: histidine phosphatase family protein [Mariprofundus sp.]|nr:histidine phosphatase family protein [Mariprofundus sp.]